MIKELTPLEALEILKDANTIYCGCASNLFARYRFEIETIETALKDCEKQKDYYAKLLESVLNDKEHKALEIIKELEVDCQDLSYCIRGEFYKIPNGTYDEYSSWYDNAGPCENKMSKRKLSQEEFDLLKEVLK